MRHVATVLLPIALALAVPPPVLAQQSDADSVTITLTGVETVVSIALSPSDWDLGEVTEDTEYKTDPEATWCTITNEGNVNVALGIKGQNALCTDTTDYFWVLSNDGTNTDHSADGQSPCWDEYALWYHVAGDTQGSYTSVLLAEAPVQKAAQDYTLAINSTGQFGLKLLTPEYLQSFGNPAETHITISAVVA
ncbi:MAG: hypothetical protein ACOC6A_01115 [Chloroflexota bacterium]